MTTSALVELLAEGLQVATHDLAIQLQNRLEIPLACKLQPPVELGKHLRAAVNFVVAQQALREFHRETFRSRQLRLAGPLAWELSVSEKETPFSVEEGLKRSRSNPPKRKTEEDKYKTEPNSKTSSSAAAMPTMHPTRASILGSSLEQSLGMALVHV